MTILDNNIELQEILNTVNALPEAGSDGGLDTSDATAVAGDILKNKTAYVNGSKVTGSMSNNGAVNKTFDGITVKSATIPAGYTSGGAVGLDSTIDNAVNTQLDIINQIESALEGKTAGGSGGSGSGNIETVTVTINDKTGFGAVVGTKLENGEITFLKYSIGSEIPNKVDVVKGSVIYISAETDDRIFSCSLPNECLLMDVENSFLGCTDYLYVATSDFTISNPMD